MRFFAFISFLLLIGCSNLADKRDITNKNNPNGDSLSIIKTSRELADTIVIERFDVFFKKFEGDSTFQYSRIVFPLKLSTVEADGGERITFIPKNKWTFTRLSDKKGVNSSIKKNQINEQEVNIEYSIEDTGVLVNHVFHKKDGKWWLVLIQDQSD